MSCLKPIVLAVSLLATPLASFAHDERDDDGWRYRHSSYQRHDQNRYDHDRYDHDRGRHFHGIEGDYAWHKEHAHLDSINHIQVHQRQDILLGVRYRDITPHEARRLLAQQDAIAAEEAYFRRNSELSYREREHLMEEFKRARLAIDRAIRHRG